MSGTRDVDSSVWAVAAALVRLSADAAATPVERPGT